MKRTLLFWFSTAIIGFSSNSFSQSRQLDSLKTLLNNSDKQDTLRVHILNNLSRGYIDLSLDSSQKYTDLALKLSEDLNFIDGIVLAKSRQGVIYRYTNRPKEAIALYEQLADFANENRVPSKLASVYINLGGVYYETNEYAKALNCFLKALKVATDYKDTEAQLVILNNTALCYNEVGLYDQSIETYKKALVINKVNKNQFVEASLNLNIASIYEEQGIHDKCIEYSKTAYTIYKNLGNPRYTGAALACLIPTMTGDKEYEDARLAIKEIETVADLLKEDKFYATVYEIESKYFSILRKYRLALKKIDDAIALTDTVNEPRTLSVRLLSKASILIHMRQYENAMHCCDLSELISTKMDDKLIITKVYGLKAETFKGIGDYKSALTYHQLSDSINDLLTTTSFATKVAVLNSLNELDKKEKELLLSLKEKESMKAKHRTQSLLFAGTLVIVILVVVLLIFSVRANRAKKRSYVLLLKQKREIQLKNVTLQENQEKIEHQKIQLEKKQSEIHDSMHYAHRIQKTLMANQALIDRNLKDNFILYKPKDIVSGDFYWAIEKNNCFYLAVCDCTGHGVPGAFMSLLNIAFLNEAVTDKKITEPHEILNYVRDKLINSVSKDGGRDGMDCILLMFDKKNDTISYAAANNKILLVTETETTLFQPDKMPVGKGSSLKSFTLNTLSAKKGNMIYLYSDGYADQFGGVNGKKFKYSQLYMHLMNQAHLPLDDQAKNMDEIFEAWRGNLEQVDDVMLVGIRV